MTMEIDNAKRSAELEPHKEDMEMMDSQPLGKEQTAIVCTQDRDKQERINAITQIRKSDKCTSISQQGTNQPQDSKAKRTIRTPRGRGRRALK